VIFCRNVLMYFGTETCRNIVQKISACLAQDGYLVLGHVEGAMASRDVFTPVKCHGTFVYQKRTKPREKPVQCIKKDRKPVFQKERVCIPAQPCIHQEQTSQKSPYHKAFQCYLKEEYQTALDYFDACLSLEKRGSKELILQALIQLHLGQYAAVETCLAVVSARTVLTPEVYMVKALYQEALKDLISAVKEGRAAAFADRNFFAPQFYLALFSDRLGKRVQAKKYYANSLRNMEKDTDERIRLFVGAVSNELLRSICERRVQS